jgi:hypothetical protein
MYMDIYYIYRNHTRETHNRQRLELLTLRIEIKCIRLGWIKSRMNGKPRKKLLEQQGYLHYSPSSHTADFLLL